MEESVYTRPAMTEDERRTICRLIAGLLTADDDFADAERHFLQRIYARFKLPAEEVAHVVPIADPGEASQALRALPDGVQAKVMALLVEAAIADGKVDARERAFLLVAAASLGIDPTDIEARITRRLETMATHGPVSNP
ncbi:MAG: TerB family tellurite resistance protein [Myxococcota bacterium]